MLQVESEKQALIVTYLKDLRDQIIQGFEGFEKDKRFQRKPWNHHGGGGGEISLLYGDVFEKAAVNWSGVYGKDLPFRGGCYEISNEGAFPRRKVQGDRCREPQSGLLKEVNDEIFPGKSNSIGNFIASSSQEDDEPFFATGVSLITHMMNPFMPTVHMNVRYIETAHTSWFGGGYDLTPMGFENEADTHHFHNVAREALGDELYKKFSQEAAEYFYIKHRKKERGVGGIFFDHYNTGHFENDLALWKNIGSTFLDAILPIYHRHVHHPYTEEDKAKQNALRAHYVEFNLLYDRGTKFGFLSGGNPEAILCSMPPTATW